MDYICLGNKDLLLWRHFHRDLGGWRHKRFEGAALENRKCCLFLGKVGEENDPCIQERFASGCFSVGLEVICRRRKKLLGDLQKNFGWMFSVALEVILRRRVGVRQ